MSRRERQFWNSPWIDFVPNRPKVSSGTGVPSVLNYSKRLDSRSMFLVDTLHAQIAATTGMKISRFAPDDKYALTQVVQEECLLPLRSAQDFPQLPTLTIRWRRLPVPFADQKSRKLAELISKLVQKTTLDLTTFMFSCSLSNTERFWLTFKEPSFHQHSLCFTQSFLSDIIFAHETFKCFESHFHLNKLLQTK